MSAKRKAPVVEDDSGDDEYDNDRSEEDEESSSEVGESEIDHDGDLNDDDYYSGNSEGEEDARESSAKSSKVGNDVPLWQRLQHMQRRDDIASSATRPSNTPGTTAAARKKRKRGSSALSVSEIMERSKSAKGAADGSRTGSKKIDLSHNESIPISHKLNPVKEGRKNKNAPAVMRSDRPVRRLRIDADNTVRKSRDPRFSDASGTLNSEKFHNSFSFLDKYQEDEIAQIDKKLKKTKNADTRTELKGELFKRKQELTERRRSLKLKDRFKAVKQEEKEKVAKGKTPYFLKRSAKKAIEMEERFSELKKEGKLGKFLNKKRKKNASKDRRWLPTRREEE